MFRTRSTLRTRTTWAVAMVATVVLGVGPAPMAFADDGSDGHHGHDRTTEVKQYELRGALIAANPEIGWCDGTVTEVPAVIDGLGQLGALGRTTVHIDATATCGADGLLGAITTVSGVYTAANGDRLRFAGHGSTISFDMEAWTGAFRTSDRFTGGTGRFIGAAGHQHISVTHDFVTNELTLKVSGEVEVPRHHSDR